MLRKLDKGITLRGLEHIRCSERAAKRRARSVAIVLGGALCFSVVSAASATNNPNKRLTSKQYAQGQLTNKNYKCLSILYGKESAWNWKAKNPHSSAYGIAQILDTPRNSTIEYQVNMGIKYIVHRYETPTNAWKFWKRNGWY